MKDIGPRFVLPMAQAVVSKKMEPQLPSLDQAVVVGSLATVVGEVPQINSEILLRDRIGHWRVRWNIGRDRFTVEPGLYGLGRPDNQSPVLVTANYKLTFDLLRASLPGRDLWILVLDTKGINVWCAAGKGTFGTVELCDRIEISRLAEVVGHRRLLLPQLGAPGVAAGEIKKHSGFRVTYGPVMAHDLPAFLDDPQALNPVMRRKSFPLSERLVLVPVELVQGLRQVLPLVLLLMLVTAFFAPGSFTEGLLGPGLILLAFALSGLSAGTILTPLLLPWLPGRAFSVNGLWAGLLLLAPLCSYYLPVLGNDWAGRLAIGGLTVTGLALASWYGMNFTGASTYSSRSGVRQEMLRAIPLQAGGVLLGVVGWFVAQWLKRGG